MTFGVKLKKKSFLCVNERGIRAVDTCSTKKCTLSGLMSKTKQKNYYVSAGKMFSLIVSTGQLFEN